MAFPGNSRTEAILKWINEVHPGVPEDLCYNASPKITTFSPSFINSSNTLQSPNYTQRKPSQERPNRSFELRARPQETLPAAAQNTAPSLAEARYTNFQQWAGENDPNVRDQETIIAPPATFFWNSVKIDEWILDTEIETRFCSENRFAVLEEEDVDSGFESGGGGEEASVCCSGGKFPAEEPASLLDCRSAGAWKPMSWNWKQARNLPSYSGGPSTRPGLVVPRSAWQMGYQSSSPARERTSMGIDHHFSRGKFNIGPSVNRLELATPARRMQDYAMDGRHGGHFLSQEPESPPAEVIGVISRPGSRGRNTAHSLAQESMWREIRAARARDPSPQRVARERTRMLIG